MNRVEALKDQVAEVLPESMDSFREDYLNEQALKVYVQTSALGFATGIRSMSSLALLGLTSDNDSNDAPSLVRWLPLVAVIGEAVADKLPILPGRTRPLPFLGRLAIGGISGFILCRRELVPFIPGVVIGAAAAGTGAFTITFLRTKLTKATKIPDPVFGILEDALVSGLGTLAMRKSR